MPKDSAIHGAKREIMLEAQFMTENRQFILRKDEGTIVPPAEAGGTEVFQNKTK